MGKNKNGLLCNYPFIYSEQILSEISSFPSGFTSGGTKRVRLDAEAEASLCEQQCVFCRVQADGVTWSDEGGWMGRGLMDGWVEKRRKVDSTPAE